MAAQIAEVAQRLLSASPAAPVPKRILTAIERGHLSGLVEALTMSDEDLVLVPNVDKVAVRALHDWVAEETESFGRRMDHREVRLILAPMFPPADDPLTQALAQLPEAALELPIHLLRDLPPAMVRWLANQGIERIGRLRDWAVITLLRETGLGEKSVRGLVDSLAELHQRIAKLDPGVRSDWATLHTQLTIPECLTDSVNAFLDELPERYRDILRSRVFTLEPETLKNVAQRYSLSRERVRQLEAKALRKMDSHGDLRTLCDEKLHKIRRHRRHPLTLSALEEGDHFFRGVERSPALLAGFLAGVAARHRVADWPRVGLCVVPDGLHEPAKLQRLVSKRMWTTWKDADLAAAVREFLAGFEAPELTDVLSQLIGLEWHDEHGWRGPPTRRKLITDLMTSELRPWSVAELCATMRGQLSVDETAVRAYLTAMRTKDHTVVLTCRSTYLAVEAVTEWKPYLETVRAFVVPMLQTDPDALISTVDLLERARDEVADWPAAMPAHALEYLLFQCEEILFAGRWLWQAADSGGSRGSRTIVDLAADILREHGAPMRKRTLLSAARERRSIGLNPVFHFPVYADAGYLYLVERDVGIPESVYRAWFAEVSDKLKAGSQPLSGAALARMLDRRLTQGHGAEPRDLLALLGSESRFVHDRKHQVLLLARNRRAKK